MTFLDQYKADLAELVNLDAGTGNPPGVTEAALIMKRHYESIGFTCELVDLGDKVGKGLIARNKPQAGRYDILLNAHLDTVFPVGEAAKRPFSVEGDTAHGPGCADCKAGCLSIFCALRDARPEDLARLSICVLHNPDEERGSMSSRAWLQSEGRKAKCALICEGARPKGELVRSRKGLATYTARFHGVSAHAGNNFDEGRNAAVAAMRFSLEAWKINAPEKGLTINPGVFHSGTVPNIVPDLAEVQFDIRFWRDEDGDAACRALEALAKRDWGEGITMEIEQRSQRPAMPFTEGTRQLVETINEAARRAGFEARWVDAGGGSDGNLIAKMGVPVVDGCGPAGGAFHTDREYLRLDTVEERVRMLSELLALL